MDLNNNSPISNVQSYQHTLSSFLPDTFPGSEKVRAVAAVALGVLAAVLITAAAVGIAYAFGVTLISHGALIFVGILALEGIILIFRNMYNVRQQIKLEQEEEKIALDLPKNPVDTSQIPPKTFLESVTSTSLLSPTARLRYGILSNCETMQEADYIFLAEHHGDPEDFVVNSRVAALLCKKNDTILNEAGPHRCDAGISTKALPSDITFKLWDNKPPMLNHYAINIRLGKIFEDLTKYAQSSDKASFDDLNEIHKRLDRLIDKINLEKNQKLLCSTDWPSAMADIEKLRKSLNDFPPEVNLKHYSECLFKIARIIHNFDRNDLLAWCEKHHTHRQIALNSSLRANNKALSRTFISAGIDHVLDENDRSKIEANLKRYLDVTKSKYFIIFSKPNRSQKASQPDDSDKKPKASSKPIDLRNLPATYTLNEIRDAATARFHDCIALFPETPNPEPQT